jgi:hypothetical protein
MKKFMIIMTILLMSIPSFSFAQSYGEKQREKEQKPSYWRIGGVNGSNCDLIVKNENLNVASISWSIITTTRKNNQTEVQVLIQVSNRSSYSCLSYDGFWSYQGNLVSELIGVGTVESTLSAKDSFTGRRTIYLPNNFDPFQLQFEPRGYMYGNGKDCD